MTKTEMIYGLAYGCPHKNRCKACLLFEIEHLSFDEKVAWIDALKDKDKDDILNYHLECSKKRSNKTSS